MPVRLRSLLRIAVPIVFLFVSAGSSALVAQRPGDTATPEMRRQWSDAQARLRKELYPDLYAMKDPAVACRGLLPFLGEHEGVEQRVLFRDVVQLAVKARDLDLLLQVYEDVGLRGGGKDLPVGRVLDLFASAMPVDKITPQHMRYLPDLLRLSEHAVQAAELDAVRCGHGLAERLLAIAPATPAGGPDVRAVRSYLRGQKLELGRIARLLIAVGRSPGSIGGAMARWGAEVDIDGDPQLARGLFALLIRGDMKAAIPPLRTCQHKLLASLAEAEFDLVDSLRSHGVLWDRTSELAERWWTEAQRKDLLGGSPRARWAFARRALEQFQWCLKNPPVGGDPRMDAMPVTECKEFIARFGAPQDALARLVAQATASSSEASDAGDDGAVPAPAQPDPAGAESTKPDASTAQDLILVPEDVLRGRYSTRKIALRGRVVDCTAEGLDLELVERLARGIGGHEERTYRWDFGFVRAGDKKGERVFRLDAIYPVEDKALWERAECEGEVVLSPNGRLKGRLRWRTKARSGEWRERKHWSEFRLDRKNKKPGK